MTDASRHFSDPLTAFIEESPRTRRPIAAFLGRAASEISNGAVVLDVGAGLGTYRELFEGQQYLSCDWGGSIYTPALPNDLTAQADALPVRDGSIDAVVCTQVLEHVPNPAAVVAEFRRVLRTGGSAWITVPFVWYLHEEPHDYFRFTADGMRSLFERAGFAEIEVIPITDVFSTLAQMAEDVGWMIGRHPDGFDGERELVAATMRRLAAVIEPFSGYDTQWLLPLNYSVRATI